MDMSRIERQYVDINLTATLRNGEPAVLAGVEVAILPVRTTPTAATAWTAADYADGTATVLLAGPDAGMEGALPVPAAGGDLWVRVTDAPEIDAARIERLTIT